MLAPCTPVMMNMKKQNKNNDYLHDNKKNLLLLF